MLLSDIYNATIENTGIDVKINLNLLYSKLESPLSQSRSTL